ncbi:type II secretion system protein [Arcobacter sp.]|uniref:type II secretion system protein n=1 Tax=Arcobacter sp. TaxID=1872629 RepID=UPI003D116179
MFTKSNNKSAFFLIELIFVILLLSLFSYIFIPKKIDSEFNSAIKRLILYLNQTKLQAFIDDKFSTSNTKWHKQRWTLKFLRCKESIGGIYYIIYSDKNMSGHAGSDDSLKDPLSKKNIFSSNDCQENSSNSEYVLLTKNFGIENIDMSCNDTDSLGQISFGSDGKVYTRLSNKENDSSSYLLEHDCFIEFKSKNNQIKKIKIYAKTGLIEEV